MFLEHTVEVDADLAEVEKRVRLLQSNLEEWAGVAYRDGEELYARVGPGGAIAHRVEVEIGGPQIHSSGLHYPVHWRATGATMLFPELEADLILSKRGLKKTSLSLRGTYKPPLGLVGRLADRLVLNRVAEATVRNWLERLARELNRDSAG